MKLEEIKGQIEPFYSKYAGYTIEVKNAVKNKPYVLGLGANTFIVGDDETTFMIDAYASRNSFRLPIKFSKYQALLADIESKEDKVNELYKSISRPKISHIICTHNHFDHVLDIKSFYDIVEKETGVKLTVVGTLSAVNTALGYNIPKEQTVVVERKKKDYDFITIGKFKITFLPGKHLKLFALYRSTYQKTPLKRKRFIFAYKEGGVLDLLIEHEGMKPLLVTSSFGLGEYHLKTVGTVFQAIGGARRVSKKDKLAILKRNVIESEAQIVYCTHYDNFLKDYKEGLHFMEVNHSIIDLFRREAPNKEIGLIKYFEKIQL